MSDIVGLALFTSFGAWWAVAPQSVVDFYTRFHRASFKPPKLVAVRAIGLLWMLLVVAVFAFSGRR